MFFYNNNIFELSLFGAFSKLKYPIHLLNWLAYHVINSTEMYNLMDRPSNYYFF